MLRRYLSGFFLVGLLAGQCGRAHAIDVLQFGYDQSHSGNNPAESVIGAANVANLQLGFAVDYPGTDGPATLLQHAMTVFGARDVLFVTTPKGIEAIDAQTGAPIWIQSVAPFEYSEGASPAIDPNRRFVYGPGSDGRVHKLDVADGTEVIDANWPIVSSAKPGIEKASSPLAIATTAQGAHYLYSVTSGYDDYDDYQGHLTAIDLAAGSFNVYNAMCSNLHVHFVAHGTAGVDDCATRLGGIWGRGGVTFDPATNRVYFTSGNGVFDASTGGHDWGDSVLALDPDGSGGNDGRPRDSYTPEEHLDLALFDEDLGSGSPAVLPAANGVPMHLGVQIGKDGVVRLLDLSNLSGCGAPGFVGGELQKIPLIPGAFGHDATPQPAIWTDVHGDGSIWVFASALGVMSGLQLTVANGQPLLAQRWMHASLSVTSSPIVANDVIYTTTQGSYGASIVALDPKSGATLWTSPPIDGCCHAQAPLVANGRLYLASASRLAMFMLPVVQSPATQAAGSPRKPGAALVRARSRVL